MLIGIELSDLSRRSRWLMLLAMLAFGAGLALYFLAPEPATRLLRVWLLAILLLGGYWVSFLVDTSARLRTGQLLLASAFGILAWLLVAAIVLLYPQLLFGIGT
ncbi:MAG: hypothetical protein Q4F49_08085 [Pseudoxanthomonas suwonensis]|nr:hypothetical protein [Pseudoxanthomonas suwonensis]